MIAPPSPLKLGLTGGIGSGKSTVANQLLHMGAHVIDADAISRATTQVGGAAMPAIAQTFGRAFVTADGSMDRVKMRELVFSDTNARAQLEAIIHPLVVQAIQIEVALARASVLVFDVPLLVERPRWRQQLDLVWVVDCLQTTQIDRVRARNGWDEPTARSVIESQSPRSKRTAAADAVLFNEGVDLVELAELVKQLANKFGL
jgi:dephospho-CoA kinase